MRAWAAALSALVLNPVLALAQTFQTTTHLPQRFEGHAMASSGQYLYHIGGQGSVDGVLAGSQVYFARVTGPGAIAAWTPTTPLPEPVFFHAGAAYNGTLYVLGGYHYSGTLALSPAVYYAKTNADGTVGQWKSATSLPQGIFFHSMAIWNGRIYVTGGWSDSGLVNSVLSATIQSDGSLSAWAPQTPLPQPVYTHTTVQDGTLYVIGGVVNGGSQVTTAVYYSKINADGSLPPWNTTTPLVQPLSNHASVVWNSRVYVIGGFTGNTAVPDVRSAPVQADGQLGAWATEPILPHAIYLHAATIHSNYLFVSGGTDGTNGQDAVYSLALPNPPPTDVLPPRTTLAIGAPRFGASPVFVAAATAFTLTAVDDGLVVGDAAGVGVQSTQWSLDAGAYNAYSAPFGVAPEGAHTLRYYSSDLAGHAETAHSINVSMDATAPVAALSIGTPKAQLSGGSTVVSPATQLAVSAQDPVSNGVASGVDHVNVAVDGAPVAASLFTLSGDGAHTIVMSAVDHVGNAQAPQSGSVSLDGTAPQTTLTITPTPFLLKNGVAVLGAGSAVALQATDPVVNNVAAGVHHIEFAIDAGLWISGSAPMIDEGAHQLRYRAVDNVGNTEAAHTAALNADFTPPQTTLTLGSPVFLLFGRQAISPDTPITLASQDPISGGFASGVAKTRYAVDGATRDYTAPFTVPLGRHRIAFWAEDNAGNVEAVRGVDVNVSPVDTLPPRTTLLVSGPNFGASPRFVSPNTSFSLGAVDDLTTAGDGKGVGVATTQWSSDGGGFVGYAAPFTLPIEGWHYLRYFSVDGVGNTEAVQVTTAAVDATAPVSTVAIGTPKAVLASGNVIVSPITKIAVSAQDPVSGGVASGVGQVLFALDGAARAPYSQPFTLPPQDGAHSISVQSIDNVMNAETPHATGVSVDATSPVTRLTANPPAYIDAGGKAYLGAASVLSFSAQDPLVNAVASGVNRTEYQLDGGSAAVVSGTLVLPEGSHTLSYRSFDNVANAEPSRQSTYLVDATPPSTTLQGPAAALSAFGLDFVPAGASVTLVAVDPISNGVASGVASTSYRLDAGPVTPYTGAVILPGGHHTLTYGSADHAGNAETLAGATFSAGNLLGDSVASMTDITLDDGASITGTVRANGAFRASDHARVIGDVTAASISLDDESRITGNATESAGTVPAPIDMDALAAAAQTNNQNAAIASLLTGGALVVGRNEDNDEDGEDGDDGDRHDGQHEDGDRDEHGRRIITLPAGDYYLTGIRLTRHARIKLGGPVHLFVHGNVKITGHVLVNAESSADNLWVFSDGAKVRLTGNDAVAMHVYSPRARLVAGGHSQLAGRILAGGIVFKGRTSEGPALVLKPCHHPGAERKELDRPRPTAGRGTATRPRRGELSEDIVAAVLNQSDPDARVHHESAQGTAPVLSAWTAPSPVRVEHPSSISFAPPPATRLPRPLPAAAPIVNTSVVSADIGNVAPAVVLGTTSVMGAVTTVPIQLATCKLPTVHLSSKHALSMVPPQGSTVRTQERSAVVVPEGALDHGLGITVAPAAADDTRREDARRQADLPAVGAGAEFGPEGTQFTKPVTLELPYDRSQLPLGAREQDLTIHYWNKATGAWEALESQVDTVAQVVRAQTKHFSLYQILGGRPSGAAASGVLAFGQVYAFPNPAKSGKAPTLHIEAGSAVRADLRIYDASGQPRHQATLTAVSSIDDGSGRGPQNAFEYTWDISGAGSGVYHFTVTAIDAGGNKIFKRGKFAVVK